MFEKSSASYQILSRKARFDIFSAHIRSLEEQVVRIKFALWRKISILPFDAKAKNEAEEKKHKHWGSLTVREALAAFLKKLASENAIHYASSWKDV